MTDADQMHIELVGNLDGLSPEGDLRGWIWSPAEPDTRRRITVLAGGVEVARGTADLPREDLAAAGIGDGGHGFAIRPAPGALRPGAAAVLTLRDADTGRQVGHDTALAVPAEPPPPAPALAGNLDQVTNDGWITGWCWYPSDPDARVALVVEVDGAPVGTATANLPRPDLAQVGVGDGAHGFSFAVPWPVMQAKGAMTVVVRAAATGEAIGLPVTLQMGLRSAAEARVADLERQVRMLRAEVALHAEQARGHDEARAARDLFRTVAGFFAELADTPIQDGFAASGLRRALAEFAGRHARLVLAPCDAPAAAILLSADAGPVDVHRAIAALIATGADRQADVVLLDDDRPECGADVALMPTVVANLRYHCAAGSPVAARNAAMVVARAPVVVFLSARVVVQHGWLDALLATLRDDPRACVVTARVLSADGSIESSGLCLADDLRPCALGAGLSPDARAWRVLHAVDAVPDAAVAVRREAFLAAGGLAAAFDDPAAALLDACLALRADGRRVLCQAQAETVRPADAAAWSAPEPEQQARLRLRWRDRPVPPAGSDPIGDALVVDGEVPRPDRDAGSVILVAQMLTLRDLGWRVTFAPAAGSPGDASAIAALERRGIAVARPARDGSITDILRAEGGTLGLVVVCRHMHAAMLFERVAALAPGARRVFLPVDLHYLREAREAAMLDRPVVAGADTRAQELACVAAADATVVHSEHEQRLLAELADPAAIHLLRWIVRADDAVPGFEPRDGLCFVGSFLHPPNADAVVWFVEAVVPILRRRRAGLVTHIVGADPPDTVVGLAAPDVVVHGWVPDLAAMLGTLRLTVAPLRFGAGFKGKVAASLAAGVPVVASPVAVEGSGLRPGDGVLVAERAEDVADAVLRLHDDPAAWREHSVRAREACRALYSPEAAQAVWGALLHELGLPVRDR